jgi:hypothetical protein
MKPMLTYLGFGASDKKYNFMGNAVGDSNWISVKTYDVLMHTLTPNVSKESEIIAGLNFSSELLDISGVIYNSDSANFIGFTKSETGVNSPNVGGPYSLEMQDLNQSLLASLNFDVEFLKLTNPPVRTDHAFFNFSMETPEGVKKVVLKKNGIELASKVLSDNPPTVQITSPKQDQTFGNFVDVSWNATDPDNDPLTYSVYCSYNPGRIIPVSAILDEPTHKIDASVFPIATNLKIIVFANDGLNIGKDSVTVVVRDPVSIESEKTSKPSNFRLYPNYPNPFNSETIIKYYLAVSAEVNLSLYNILGQKIATLVNTNQHAGNYTFVFKGSDLVSGIYFCKLQTKDYVEIRKILLAK